MIPEFPEQNVSFCKKPSSFGRCKQELIRVVYDTCSDREDTDVYICIAFSISDSRGKGSMKTHGRKAKEVMAPLGVYLSNLHLPS